MLRKRQKKAYKDVFRTTETETRSNPAKKGKLPQRKYRVEDFVFHYKAYGTNIIA